MYKTNAREIYFIPFINHTKARTLLRFFILDLSLLNYLKLLGWLLKGKLCEME